MPTNVTGLPQVVAGPTVGVEAASPPNITQHKIAPTTTDYYNFNTGDLWLQSVPTNTTPVAGTLRAWMLAAKNANGQGQKTATWIPFFNGAAGSLVSLTGNTGGAVFGDANQNVNTIGDNVGIVVTGTPGNNTLTWSLVGGGQAAQSFVANSPVATPTVIGGTASPIAGVINVQASHNISVSAGTPNTGAANDIVYWGNNVITLGDLAPANTLISGYATTNDNVPATINLLKSRAGSAVTNTTVTGQITTYGWDGTQWVPNTAIIAAVQPSSTVDLNRVAGNLQFFTHPDSTSAITQRMSIVSDGSVAILGQDVGSTNPALAVGNSSGGTGFTLNLAHTYGVPPNTPQDILVIDSAGNVGTGGAFITGTFTPTLTFSTSTGTITYVSQGGKYTQIGNVVYFAATVAVSSIGTSSGTMRMSGFPVTVSTLTNTAQNVAAQFSGALTLSMGYSDIFGSGIATTTSFTIDQEGSGVNSTTITDANVTIGGGTPNFTLTLSGFYFSS